MGGAVVGEGMRVGGVRGWGGGRVGGGGDSRRMGGWDGEGLCLCVCVCVYV